MNRALGVLTCLLLVWSFCPANEFVPIAAFNFEDYEVGTPLREIKPFDACARSQVSSAAAAAGKKSLRLEIKPGDKGGFGRWGFVYPIRPELRKGEEIWVRIYVLWPNSFQFSAEPWMKFIRLHSKRANGKNGGYNDLLIDNAAGGRSVFRSIKEFDDIWAVYDGGRIPRNQWMRFEVYMYIHHKSRKDEGKARYRAWCNDKLLFDREDCPVLFDQEGTIDYFYFLTYWNGEKPPANHCFADELVIATHKNPPTNKDALGNRMIGGWKISPNSRSTRKPEIAPSH